jgi:uncharacterized membrane protein
MVVFGLGQAGEGRETQRLEAFSDGIFAIAVTLLILEVRVPIVHDPSSEGALGDALRGLWPAYLAYATSFATILVTWINHHAVFRLIARSDHTFLLLNGLLLAIITAVNFPTALLAEYIGHPGERTAALVYTGTFIAMAFAFNAIWRYATAHGRLLSADADPALVRAINGRFRFGPLFYVIPFALAFVSAGAAFGLCMLLAVLYALPYSPKRQAEQP